MPPPEPPLVGLLIASLRLHPESVSDRQPPEARNNCGMVSSRGHTCLWIGSQALPALDGVLCKHHKLHTEPPSCNKQLLPHAVWVLALQSQGCRSERTHVQSLYAEARSQLGTQPQAGAQPDGKQARLVIVQLERLDGAAVIDLCTVLRCVVLNANMTLARPVLTTDVINA